MREIVHLQAGQCGNQIGAKVSVSAYFILYFMLLNELGHVGNSMNGRRPDRFLNPSDFKTHLFNVSIFC